MPFFSQAIDFDGKLVDGCNADEIRRKRVSNKIARKAKRQKKKFARNQWHRLHLNHKIMGFCFVQRLFYASHRPFEEKKIAPIKLSISHLGWKSLAKQQQTYK